MSEQMKPYRSMALYSAELTAMVRGYLACAAWADGPEGAKARFTMQARERALIDCTAFAQQCGILAVQALELVGYDADQFGHDFWLSRCGHGVSFRHRDMLKVPVKTLSNYALCGMDRQGQLYQIITHGGTLADALMEIAYGTARSISCFAYPGLAASGGWLHFL